MGFSPSQIVSLARYAVPVTESLTNGATCLEHGENAKYWV